MGAIDIGSNAENRNGSGVITTTTRVDKNNPANDSGIITDIYIWLSYRADAGTVWVGTFSAVGNVLTCRDSVNLGDVPAGSEQHYGGLSLAVAAGDYIGVYAKTGTQYNIEYTTNAGAGWWYYAGECIDPSDSQTFTSGADKALSLNGVGVTLSNIAKIGSVDFDAVASVGAIAIGDISDIGGVAI